MMDFWTVLGNLTMDYPGLLNTAATPMPGFTKISMAVVQVTSDLPPTVKTFAKKAAGYLLQDDTNDLRTRLSNYTRAKYGKPAPVVSLYTAGKVCQLLNTFPGLKGALSSANAMVMDATKSKPPKTMWFAALLGVCLIDSKLSTLVNDPIHWGIAKEFGGIDPGDKCSEEGVAILAVINHKDFGTVQKSILTAPSWDQCKEQLFFYPGFENAAN
jgi:hypothetical protein